MPLTQARVTRMLPAVQNLVGGKPLCITVSEEESILWKQLLPALAERYRYTWTHSDACEYRVQGRIPLSTAHNENPLCSCGEGRAIEAFPTRSECMPLARYVTRIAISPISAVPYVESMCSPNPQDKLGFSALRQMGQSYPASLNVPLSAAVMRCGNCGKQGDSLKTSARCGKAMSCDQARG